MSMLKRELLTGGFAPPRAALQATATPVAPLSLAAGAATQRIDLVKASKALHAAMRIRLDALGQLTTKTPTDGA